MKNCPTCQIMRTPWWLKLLGGLVLVGALWLYTHLAGIRVSIQPTPPGTTAKELIEKAGFRFNGDPP
jgi:hypothetical protein